MIWSDLYASVDMVYPCFFFYDLLLGWSVINTTDHSTASSTSISQSLQREMRYIKSKYCTEGWHHSVGRKKLQCFEHNISYEKRSNTKLLMWFRIAKTLVWFINMGMNTKENNYISKIHNVQIPKLLVARVGSTRWQIACSLCGICKKGKYSPTHFYYLTWKN